MHWPLPDFCLHRAQLSFLTFAQVYRKFLESFLKVSSQVSNLEYAERPYVHCEIVYVHTRARRRFFVRDIVLYCAIKHV